MWVFRPSSVSFRVVLLFPDVCSDSRCLSADVKQRVTGMRCQMEPLVYFTDTDTDRERLNLWFEGPAATFSWSHRVPKQTTLSQRQKN